MKRGKKSTKYFFNLEKKKGKEKLWNRVKTNDGKYKEDIVSILEEQVNFFEKLFTSEGWDSDSAAYLLNNLEKKLSQEDKEICDEGITLDEISKAVKLQKPDKSPGEDGIVSEFYRHYWYLIGEDFESVVREIFDQKLLSESQNRGIITLMFKSGEREDIKNWRPITLLNVDYKIVSKILAERLKRVLPNIINTDQRGFVKGRNIFQGNRLLQDIIDYTEMEDEEGAIIFLDQQKAFDRVEWGWIDLCFEKFGFSDCFRGWVKMLFKNAKTSIQTNGFVSRFVNISRSIRQGCPIAPMLYILQAEPLATSIRRNPKIVGISLPNRNGPDIETKVNMFADDTQLINKTEESIEETFKTLEIYEKASGAKMNLEKTVGMYLGKWRNKNPRFKNIKWSTKPVKALGVFHGYAIDLEMIWLEKINKIKSCMEVWKSRDLTYFGKILIIKSFVLSVIGYEIEMRGIPVKFEKEINSIIWDFIWDGKTNQISRNVCSLPQNKGGMGMVNLNHFIKAKQVKCMHNIIHSELDKWNVIGKYWLTSMDSKFETDFFLCKCSDIKDIGLRKISKYYLNLLNCWSEFLSLNKINTKENILEQHIFGNSKIRYKRKALFLSNFSKSGFKTVKDIWDQNSKIFVNSTEIFNRLRDKRNWIAEYSRIKASFSLELLLMLKSDNINQENTKSYPFTVKNTCEFIKNDNILENKKLLLKDIQYFFAIENIPICQQKWEIYFGVELPWEEIWGRHFKNLANRKSKQLQWKVIHRIIYTEERLQKMNKSPNGSCHFCKDPENLMHLFVNCKLVDSVWTEIFQKINEFYEQNEIKTISKSENSIILGISHRDDQINAIVNTILTTTKWMIWKERNVAKYQKKKITKLKIINLIKSEISFIFSLAKSKTGNNIYTEMTNMFCI
jgi:hypothetical protein